MHGNAAFVLCVPSASRWVVGDRRRAGQQWPGSVPHGLGTGSLDGQAGTDNCYSSPRQQFDGASSVMGKQRCFLQKDVCHAPSSDKYMLGGNSVLGHGASGRKGKDSIRNGAGHKVCRLDARQKGDPAARTNLDTAQCGTTAGCMLTGETLDLISQKTEMFVWCRAKTERQ